MTFDLMVFAADPRRAHDALGAGASAVIVDWECRNKEYRQQGADTEINRFGPAELGAVRRAVDGHVVCRVNGMHANSRDEIDAAISAGAQEIFLPMVRRVDEAEQLLVWTCGRAKSSILIETVDAVRLAPELGQLPLTRIYVGLNDLAIDLGNPSLFTAAADGILDRIRPHIRTDFGFGGLTLPERGSPIPCELLMSEMVRLQCGFTFLRRSFWRDAQEVGVPDAIRRIRNGLARTAELDARELDDNRMRFCRVVREQLPMGARV